MLLNLTNFYIFFLLYLSALFSTINTLSLKFSPRLASVTSPSFPPYSVSYSFSISYTGSSSSTNPLDVGISQGSILGLLFSSWATSSVPAVHYLFSDNSEIYISNLYFYSELWIHLKSFTYFKGISSLI